MTRQLTPYQQLISEATGLVDPLAIEEVEDLMRLCEGGCLDHLAPDEFKQLAKDSKDALEEVG